MSLKHFFVFPVGLALITSCSSLNKGKHCLTINQKIIRNGFYVTYTIYRPSTPTQKSLIILPPTGGTNFIDRSYAKTFCQAGYDVFIIDGWKETEYKTIDLELHNHFYSLAQQAIDLTLEQIQTPFIGLLGTSVGALHGSVAANRIERIQAVFLITGGAPIPEVIVTSDQKAMVELKMARRKQFGFKNNQENITAIQKVFSYDPISSRNLYLHKDIGMVIAEKDSTVPTVTQNKLKNFFNPEKVIHFPNNHFWTIIKTWLLKDEEILQFFEDSQNSHL